MPYGRIAVMVLLHLSEAILFDAVLVKCMLALDSAIYRLVLKGELGGGSIL